MTQHHDLRVLERLAAAQQDEPAEHPDYEQVIEGGPAAAAFTAVLMGLTSRLSASQSRLEARRKVLHDQVHVMPTSA